MSNPKDINSNHHIMLTRSKRKIGSDSVISIDEPLNQKTLKKMKNSNNFFELGDDWDEIEEELYYNDLDNNDWFHDNWWYCQ